MSTEIAIALLVGLLGGGGLGGLVTAIINAANSVPKARAEAIESQQSVTNNNLAAMQTVIETLKSENCRLMGRIDELEIDMERLSHENIEREKKIDALERYSAQLEDRISSMKDELDQLKIENESLMNRVEELEKENAELRKYQENIRKAGL